MKPPAQAQHTLQLERQTPIAAIPQSLPDPKRLLMVNTDPNFLMLIRDYLEFLGYEVVTANQGLEALKGLDHLLPDALILGGGMSEMSDRQLFERLCEEHSRYRQIPVVILTERENAQSDGYFYAPLQPEKLIAVLQGILEQAPASATDEAEAVRSQELES